MGYILAITFVARILACSVADLAAFVPWHAGGAVVGRVHRDRVPQLLARREAFQLVDGQLMLAGAEFTSRSAAIASIVERLIAAGELRPALGEFYPVCAELDPEPRLQIDRTAVAYFGVRAAGVHLNGWVRRAAGLHVWVAERSRQKRSYPGHLDNLVAGGAAIGLSPRQTLEKECHEEAGIPAEVAQRSVAVGSLRYVMQEGMSLKPDHLDCFDLELPADFVPRPVDGEVETFSLWPVADVSASLRGSALWKPNCALVMIDFLLRHGALDGELPAAERWALWQRLHR